MELSIISFHQSFVNYMYLCDISVRAGENTKTFVKAVYFHVSATQEKMLVLLLI